VPDLGKLFGILVGLLLVAVAGLGPASVLAHVHYSELRSREQFDPLAVEAFLAKEPLRREMVVMKCGTALTPQGPSNM